MVSENRRTIECTEIMLLWCLIEKAVFKVGFEKRNKIPFLHKTFHEDCWKGITLFSSRILILHQ